MASDDDHLHHSILSSLHETNQKCLNVLQGEVAHATPEQADWILSAEATTCHIVAMRSTTTTTSPLVSLAHIDQANVYDHCIDQMIQEHIAHHQNNHPSTTTSSSSNDNESNNNNEEYGFYYDGEEDIDHEERKDNHAASSFFPNDLQEEAVVVPQNNTMIEMEVHLSGGYLDPEGTSQKLSTYLILTLDRLGKTYQHQLRMYLSTAAISCMNDQYMHDDANEEEGNRSTTSTTTASSAETEKQQQQPHAPICRGMGMNTRTGQVIPITSSLPEELQGPAVEIRSARSWVRPSHEPASLHIIHDGKCHHRRSSGSVIRVQPFQYQPHWSYNVLLTAPDHVLKQYTSTSPHVESDRFCTDVRRTLSFVLTVPPESVFGNDCQKPLVYTRSASNLNAWETVE
jgi:hypothetical protein